LLKRAFDEAEDWRGAPRRTAHLARAQLLEPFGRAGDPTPRPEPAAVPAQRVPATIPRRQRVARWIAELDLAPDLGYKIGSARWLRGLATLIALITLALAAFPGFGPVVAAPAVRLDEAARDEFRSNMIMPLALGADSGRRMGATRAVTPLTAAPERPRMDLVATLSAGDGFARMLTRAGVSDDEADAIATMVAGAVPLADIEAGTQVDITLGRRADRSARRPVEALSFRARFDLELAVARSNGRLVLDPRPIRVDATPLRIRGTVGDSLYRSARAAGAPAGAVQQYLRAIAADLDGMAAGDEFDFVLDYRRAATGEVETGQLLYAGILRDGKPRRQLLRWGREGRFYDAAGEGELREGLVAPVPGAVSSRFGMRRHPILGIRRMHAGLDFRAGHGTPIYAATDGRVQFAGRNGGYGNYVKLSHAGGLGTGYAHMSRIAVRSGAQVRRGQVIGYVGSTGLSTGPHLHYEMYRGGAKIDPASVSFVRRAQLSGRELASFKERLAMLLRVEPGAALASLAPDPAETAEPAREIDRLQSRQKVG
jgi:murein DD-endopeptidase MepM/ murein hydrolase activator NlpD